MNIAQDYCLDYLEDEQSLLSTKIKQLQQRNSQPTLANINETKAFTFQKQNEEEEKPSRTHSLDPRNIKKADSLKTRKSQLKNKRKKSQKADTLLTTSNILKKKGITLFETSQFSGRRPSYAQVKDIPVTEFTGQGLLVLPNKKKFEGEWVEGKMIGIVKIHYPNGSIYKGQTYQYERHGRGQLRFEDKKYVGQFSGNDFHGEGILYDSQDNILYDGLWRRGKKWDK